MADEWLDNEAEYRSGPIHLGATRPPMVPWLGIPFSAAVPMLLIAAEVQMAVTGLQGLAYAIGIVLLVTVPVRIWVAYDWYAIECVIAWARTAGPAFDNPRWGGSSVSPFPVRPAEPRGLV